MTLPETARFQHISAKSGSSLICYRNEVSYEYGVKDIFRSAPCLTSLCIDHFFPEIGDISDIEQFISLSPMIFFKTRRVVIVWRKFHEWKVKSRLWQSSVFEINRILACKFVNFNTYGLTVIISKGLSIDISSWKLGSIKHRIGRKWWR